MIEFQIINYNQMKYKKLTLSILLFCMGLTAAYAQQAFTSAGGDSTSTGGTVSYSIGTVVYTTNSGTNGSVAQGVQQPYEISVITGVEEEIINPGISCTVFPNPASDVLTLQIKHDDYAGLSYKLFSANGSLLESKQPKGYETGIIMKHFTPASYFLKVYRDNQEIETFQIIKHK